MDNRNKRSGMDRFFDGVAGVWAKVKGYINGIGTDWVEDRKARAVGKVILPLVPVALVVALLVFLWHIRATIGKIISGLLLLWVIIYACMQGRGQNDQAAAKSDAIVMKNAKQGLNALLDHIFLVCESLAEQTEIYSPRTKSELAYPDMTRCINIEDGVAVVTVQLHYVGKIDTAQFLERFNNRMAQKLNNGELLGKPPAVFTDKDNEPHTAIQAIRCIPVKGKQYVRLEVIRVNQEALALMDKIDREKAPEAGGETQLYDDDL